MALNARETLCQQCADECLRSQFLKTRANNKCIAEEIMTKKSKAVHFGKLVTSSMDGVPPCIISTSGGGVTYAAHVSDGGDVVEEKEGYYSNNSTCARLLDYPLTQLRQYELAKSASYEEEGEQL
ncbi:hypothetical protein ACA910_017888 [Epithemia clementina (nom. ined.)]